MNRKSDNAHDTHNDDADVKADEKDRGKQAEKHADKHADKSTAKGTAKASDRNTEKHREKGERKRRRAVDAYARLQRAATLSAAAADAVLSPYSLSASQLGVLETLQSRGPLHQQELARTLGRSKAQMTAIIDALEKRGAASRERHATDRRYTTVHLTSEGSALLAEVRPIRVQAVVELMGALSGEQRARLARLCRRIVKALAPEEDEREDTAEHADAHDSEGDAEHDAEHDAERKFRTQRGPRRANRRGQGRDPGGVGRNRRWPSNRRRRKPGERALAFRP